MRTFLIGGARSGKSTLAARWAAERSNSVCYIATATASDDEMAARIDAHRRERPAHWRVLEEPMKLAGVLRAPERPGELLLVDCLTLWTANCLWPSPGDGTADRAGWLAEREDFLAVLRQSTRDLIIVSNEVGAGIVPENPAARLFRDEHGRLNQLVAAVCDEVFLVTAGLTLRLK